MRRQAILVFLFVLAVRLPFLNQAIQGDDYYYLAAAQHAQVDAAHPHHARYVFLGIPMDMRGHPHPPGNAWLLGALLAVIGDIREVPFHAAYGLLSLLAAFSMLALARRFVPERALEATLLFCAVPAFLVNGGSLEADLPLLAFWMLSMALVVSGQYGWAAPAMAACSITGYQSVVLIPIVGLWLWQQGELRRRWWLLAIPVAVIGGYQVFERITAGEFPALVLNQHFQTYGLQRLEMKLKNAVALSGHLVVMLTPIGFWALLRRRDRFLTAWVGIFFATALVLFFAGSARYLLPLAAPFAIVVARHYSKRPALLWTCFALSLALGLGLAWVNYQHWDGYRRFAADAMRDVNPEHGKRVWVNGEWGLRFYSEARGALPVEGGQALRPGDYVITSELAERIAYTTGGGKAVEQARMAIMPTLPLRLIGLGARSGYSSVGFGLRPFDVTTAPVDVVTMSLIVDKKPELSWLPMATRSAENQIVSGVYKLENDQWRWMGARAVFLLKPPAGAAPLAAQIYIPDTAPGRTVALTVDGVERARTTFAAPGVYTLATAALKPEGESVTVVLSIDKEFTAPGDGRRLGMIVTGVGFPPPQ
ncbi:MAG: glycosyltransferase family 39 protein [Acidobacteria bacterium]|nr:glycosyltransferase family 39 protein [Acidobacteriota bacterium]